MVTKDTQFALQLISIKWLEEIEEGCASRRIIISQSNKFTFFSYQNSIPGEGYDWLNEWIQSVGHPSENNDMSNPPSPNLLLLLLFLRVFRTSILLVNCVVGRPDLTLCFTPNHPQMNTTRIYAARSTTTTRKGKEKELKQKDIFTEQISDSCPHFTYEGYYGNVQNECIAMNNASYRGKGCHSGAKGSTHDFRV